jgi:hypothetical protein
MKKFLVLAALVAALSASRFVAAGENNDPKAEKKALPQAKVEMKGMAISIGPDGKVEVKSLGDATAKEMLDKLPAEIREKLSQPEKKAAPEIKTKTLATHNDVLDKLPREILEKLSKSGSPVVGRGTLIISEGSGEKRAAPEVKLGVTGFGAAIRIGRDGQVEVIKGGAIPREVLDKLPAELREKLCQERQESAPSTRPGKIKVTVEPARQDQGDRRN